MTQASPHTTPQQAPFLTWPVSRREFYRAIWISMLLAITWGVLVFGVRALIMLVASVAAMSIMHFLLKVLLKWKLAGCLLYAHNLVSVMVLVALASPTWPAWILAAAAALFPLIFAWIGGPGRERIPVAVATVLLIQYLLLPALAGRTYTGCPDAIVARDRLFMGDIRDQHAPIPGSASLTSVPGWPASRELAGNDAFPMTPPAVTAADAFNQVSTVLAVREAEFRAPLGQQEHADIQQILEHAFAFELPSMDLFMAGISPNRIGAASLPALLLAGLFLAYRYILRPRSVFLFLLAFIAATVVLAFTPQVFNRVGGSVLLDVIKRFPGELITLLEYLVLNSDAPFGAVFLLALPGAEPLSPRGRRVFLLLVAVLAAALHRFDPAAPATTLILCLFIPLAPYFDRLLAKRSWLAGATPTRPSLD